MKHRLLILSGKYKRLLISLSVVIAVILLLNLFVIISVDYRAENIEVCNLVKSATCITNVVGEINHISYRRNRSRIAFFGKQINGIYNYDVTGSIKSGVVIRVYWSGESANTGVSIDRIELLEPWKKPLVLYPDDGLKSTGH